MTDSPPADENRPPDSENTCRHAFAIARARPQGVPAEARLSEAIGGGWTVEIAGAADRDWAGLAQDLFADDTHVATLQCHDIDGGCCLVILDGRALAAVLLVRSQPLDAKTRAWLAARLGTPLDPAEQFRLFSGRPGGAMKPRGDTVCRCCDVRRNEITAAIAAGFTTVATIGAATRAGSNCGRCHPDIAHIIAEHAVQ